MVSSDLMLVRSPRDMTSFVHWLLIRGRTLCILLLCKKKVTLDYHSNLNVIVWLCVAEIAVTLMMAFEIEHWKCTTRVYVLTENPYEYERKQPRKHL